MRMNPEVKTRWVAALRSGEYEQNRDGYLNADGKQCCLGVLCEIEGVDKVQVPAPIARPDAVIFAYGVRDDRAYPPVELMDAVGIQNSAGLVPGLSAFLSSKDLDSGDSYLAALNDDGFTFSQIADIIEYFL